MDTIATNSPIKLWESLTTPKNADCVSFCKVAGFEHLLLCANYQLDPNTQIHSGGLLLYDTSKKYSDHSVHIIIDKQTHKHS